MYFSFLRAVASVLILAFVGCASLESPRSTLSAPNPGTVYETQKSFSRVACGPVSLVNSLRSSSPRWQEALESYPMDHSGGQARAVSARHGLRRSSVFQKRPRWNRRSGIALIDLTEMANEMASPYSLPKLSYAVYASTQGREKREFSHLMRQASRSLKRGFAPLMSLTRVVERQSPDGMKHWTSLGGHLVTLSSLTPLSAETSQLEYIDPLDGKRYEATLSLPQGAQQSVPQYAIIVDAPHSRSFLNKVRAGERSVLTLSAMMGCF